MNDHPEAACAASPQGAAPLDRQSRIHGGRLKGVAHAKG